MEIGRIGLRDFARFIHAKLDRQSEIIRPRFPRLALARAANVADILGGFGLDTSSGPYCGLTTGMLAGVVNVRWLRLRLCLSHLL